MTGSESHEVSTTRRNPVKLYDVNTMGVGNVDEKGTNPVVGGCNSVPTKKEW